MLMLINLQRHSITWPAQTRLTLKARSNGYTASHALPPRHHACVPVFQARCGADAAMMTAASNVFGAPAAGDTIT
jgi:hypothetical protein